MLSSGCMFRVLVSVVAVACAGWLSACGEGGASGGGARGSADAGGNGEAGEQYRIVTTVGMITDIAERVAGERAEVVGLIGPGVDPHLFKPTRSDIATLMGADVVFYNGLLLEGKMTDALVRVANGGKKVYAVTELLDESVLLEPEAFEGHPDPHVWMDPSAWAKSVEVVRDRLIEFDPDGEAGYRERGSALIAEMDALDAYAARVLGSVPERSRTLITAHDAFNYLARRYGFSVEGIQGLSTESEAGVRDIERLVSLIVENGIGAVFVESTVSDRNVSALIEGAGARGHEVRIGGRLFSDAMGPAGTYEGTYIGMIDHNVTTIARALGGEAPERGLNGRLSAGGGW